MTVKAILNQAKTLPADQRIQLAQELWDTIAEEPDSVEISDAHRRILDQRLREHEANPLDVVPWEVAKAEINEALEQYRRRRAARTAAAKTRKSTSSARRKSRR